MHEYFIPELEKILCSLHCVPDSIVAFISLIFWQLYSPTIWHEGHTQPFNGTNRNSFPAKPWIYVSLFVMKNIIYFGEIHFMSIGMHFRHSFPDSNDIIHLFTHSFIHSFREQTNNRNWFWAEPSFWYWKKSYFDEFAFAHIIHSFQPNSAIGNHEQRSFKLNFIIFQNVLQ